ncbi:hypothetical protein [Simplicispira hankyongi]|uniref:Nuclear transport factor 2 family protein n=1 Tax=Simplicispira hankyongi TaxID=2315688 RepID=A0A398C8I0_9BURK|nr:hypothetical protein [Simplicispira hankyongi]RID98624.1 hypothetical protein D3F03_10470 [Simplicispira hankyongi]
MTNPASGRRRTSLGLLLAASLAMSGCAMLAPKTPEQQVQAKAAEYWKARVANDYKKAYTLLVPSYRKIRTDEQFRQQFGEGASIASAEVTKVTCEATRCEAQVKLGVKTGLPSLGLGTVTSYLTDVWLLEDGAWWRFQGT